MNYALVGLYGLFFVFVGINGHASELIKDIEEDAKGFAPWLLAIFILKGLASSEKLAPVVNPFIGLAILTFVLKNYSTIINEVETITGLQLDAEQ